VAPAISTVALRRDRTRRRLAAAGLLPPLLLAALPANAQTPRLESAYVVLGPQGAVARAILADASTCPAITIDGARQPMSVRAPPDALFPVLVCEKQIPAGTASASLENSALPLPKRSLGTIAAFGDTGCRLKSRELASKDNDPDDAEYRGKFQDCNIPSKWPFAQLAASVAAAKPDLVIHVGDYLYRESACPVGDTGCARSPHGDDWPTWKADFFAPAAPALLAAPWIVVRGNHEICSRAGAGYFRLLDPAPAQAPPPCIDVIPQFPVTLGERAFIVLDSSNAADKCPCDPTAYAAQFAAMRPPPGTWLLTHRPVWGFGPHRRTLNASLQQALAARNGRLPDGIALVLSGHIHLAEVLSFADKRAPQFVLGTGGTLLAGKIKGNLAGRTIGGTRVSYGRSDHRFGFAILERGSDGWSATFNDAAGTRLFACTVAPGEVGCD
jgi:calcineurin-like phosphoesterase family protein